MLILATIRVRGVIELMEINCNIIINVREPIITPPALSLETVMGSGGDRGDVDSVVEEDNDGCSVVEEEEEDNNGCAVVEEEDNDGCTVVRTDGGNGVVDADIVFGAVEYVIGIWDKVDEGSGAG